MLKLIILLFFILIGNVLAENDTNTSKIASTKVDITIDKYEDSLKFVE